MNKSFQMLCLVSVALTPGLASAQAITAFEGTYTGVSRNTSGSGRIAAPSPPSCDRWPSATGRPGLRPAARDKRLSRQCHSARRSNNAG
jgi:hypothetical protein